jgi:hypothetical protein
MKPIDDNSVIRSRHTDINSSANETIPLIPTSTVSPRRLEAFHPTNIAGEIPYCHANLTIPSFSIKTEVQELGLPSLLTNHTS